MTTKMKVAAVALAVFGLITGIPVLAVMMNPDLLHERPLNSLTFRLVHWAYPIDVVKEADQPIFLENKTSEHVTKMPNLDNFHDETFTTSMVVLKDSKMIYEKYFYASSKSDRFLVHSISKSVLSLLVGVALEQGHISSLDSVVREYLPELKTTAFANVRIEDLLQMSSGVEMDEDWTKPHSAINQFAEAILSFDKHVIDVVARLPSKAPSGTIFAYATTDTQVLGWILEKATGKTLAQYASEVLWQPMGAERPAFYYLTFKEPQTAIGGGSLCASTRDLAKVGDLVRRNGLTLDGRQVLPAQWIEKSARPSQSFREVGTLGPNYSNYLGYQNLWWILNGDGSEVTGMGIYGQFLYINRNRGIVIMKTSAWPTPDNQSLERKTIEQFRSLADSL